MHVEYTKPRVQKLGVRAGDRVALIGVTERGFRGELRGAGARIVEGGSGADLSAVFLQADTRVGLRSMAQAARMIAADGAVWLITPRGVRTVTEADALAAGRSARLTDIKVIRFSDTHTAHKFVIPLAARGRRRTR